MQNKVKQQERRLQRDINQARKSRVDLRSEPKVMKYAKPASQTSSKGKVGLGTLIKTKVFGQE